MWKPVCLSLAFVALGTSCSSASSTTVDERPCAGFVGTYSCTASPEHRYTISEDGTRFQVSILVPALRVTTRTHYTCDGGRLRTDTSQADFQQMLGFFSGAQRDFYLANPGLYERTESGTLHYSVNDPAEMAERIMECQPVQ